MMLTLPWTYSANYPFFLSYSRGGEEVSLLVTYSTARYITVSIVMQREKEGGEGVYNKLVM